MAILIEVTCIGATFTLRNFIIPVVANLFCNDYANSRRTVICNQPMNVQPSLTPFLYAPKIVLNTA